jgi:hypothetical protein
VASRLRIGAVPPLHVREAPRSRVYHLSRPDRGRAVVVHDVSPDGGIELTRSEGRGGVDWVQLAGAILTDALGRRPPEKVSRDLARFIVTPPGLTRSMSGAEVDAWLATWQPPLATLFPKRARGG